MTDARTACAGLTFEHPNIMGILNVTPDSFSDGGRYLDVADAVGRAREMIDAGADILDIGGESTRPGASAVDAQDEIARVVPVITALRSAGLTTPISIDTRKAEVARRAVAAGADLINDVSAMRFDPDMAATMAKLAVPVCLMHAQGTPEVMQDDPRYGDVVQSVYDDLAERVQAAVAAGVAADQIIVDPGIGFGKTQDHNIALLQSLNRFHGLGCPILLGASRKRFIGAITGVEAADARLAGSLIVAADAVRQGVQILRVHDVAETRAAVAMQMALLGKMGI